MDAVRVETFFAEFAPADVRTTIAWLRANGYVITQHLGEGTFGATFRFSGGAEVVVTVDRSQWCLDVARDKGAAAWQYDLLIVAWRGQHYSEVFPRAGNRELSDPLPDQLPSGVSWSETLPAVLEWMLGADVAEAVGRARQERFNLVRPRNPDL